MNAVRVYLIDELKLFAESLQALLESRSGYLVAGISQDINSALGHLRRTRPHLVIVEVALRDANGPQAVRLVHGQVPEAKVIALTAHWHAGLASHFFRAGGAGYLLKSSSASQFFNALELAVRGEKVLSPEVSEQLLPPDLEAAEERRLDLSPREYQVLRLLVQGKRRREISDLLNISVRTLDTHRSNILNKLGCRNTAELVHYAIQARIL